MAKTKYQDKHLKEHYVKNGYTIRKELSEEFKAKCKELKVSQRSVIIGFMEEFINKN